MGKGKPHPSHVREAVREAIGEARGARKRPIDAYRVVKEQHKVSLRFVYNLANERPSKKPRKQRGVKPKYDDLRETIEQSIHRLCRRSDFRETGVTKVQAYANFVDGRSCPISLSSFKRQVARLPSLHFRLPHGVYHLSYGDKRKRLAFCKEMRDFDLQGVYFTDEKAWRLCGRKKMPTLYPVRWGRPTKKTNTYNAADLMVWGAISASGNAVLAFIEGTMDGDDYARLIQAYIPDGATLIHDNASPHTSNKTKEVLEEKQILNIRLPPRSPELNPIERAWGVLTQRIYKGNASFKNVEEMKSAIIREWRVLSEDRELLVNLALTFHKIRAKIEAAHGDHIKD